MTSLTASRHTSAPKKTSWWDEIEWFDIGSGFPLVAGITIDPVMAERMLAGNGTNRRLKIRAKERYKRDMSEGRWSLNGETIIFTGTGRLLNGQHRLAACVESGAAFQSIVVFGVPDLAIDDMDSGVIRLNADMFSIHGVKNAFCVSAAVSWIWRHERGILIQRNTCPSRSEAQRVLDDHPGITDVVHKVSCMNEVKKMGGPSVHAFLLYVFSRNDHAAAETFYQKLETGADLSQGSPILVLRNALTGPSQKRRSPVEVIGMTIKAWNAFRDGKTIKALRFVPGGDLPEQMPAIKS